MSTHLSGSVGRSTGLWGKGILPTWGPLSTNGGSSSLSLVIFIYTTAHATQNPLGLRKSPN